MIFVSCSKNSLAVTYWTDWLDVCVRVWPIDRRCELLWKAFKYLFWSPILRPLSPAPGDNCPPAPTLRYCLRPRPICNRYYISPVRNIGITSDKNNLTFSDNII